MVKPPNIKQVQESLTVSSSSPRSVMERVEIAVRGLSGYTLARPTPDVAHIAFVVKKRLGSSSHVCTVSISNSARGMTVTIQGELEAGRIDPLRAAVLGTSMDDLRDRDRDPGTFGPPTFNSVGSAMGANLSIAAPLPPQSSWQPVGQSAPPPQPMIPPMPMVAPMPVVPARPPARGPEAGVSQPRTAWSSTGSGSPPQVVHNPLDNALENGRTIIRPFSGANPRSSGPAGLVSHLRPIEVVLADGRRLALVTSILIGRDPVARADDRDAIAVAINDDGVSKTHLSIGRTGDDTWIEDRSSTNGTMIVDTTGRQIVIPTGLRTVVTLPTTVVIGETHITLTWG